MEHLAFLSDFIIRFDYLGYWLFLISAFIESAPLVGVFIPGATLISFGGLMAYEGYFSWIKIAAYSCVGAIMGDYLSYYLGRHGGTFAERFIKPQYLASGKEFFDKYGNKSVFIGRFIGPVRAIIPFVAGFAGMGKRPFLVWNVTSAVLWSVTNVLLGYFSGTMIAVAVRYWSSRLSMITLVVAGTLIVLWVLHRRFSIFSKLWDSMKHVVYKNFALPLFNFLSGHFLILSEYLNIPSNRRKFFLFVYLLAVLSLILWIHIVWENLWETRLEL